MTEPLQLGRYSLYAQLASGGMATVYLGRLNGEVGFGRTVAIKRLHAHMAREPEFVTMFLDEAHMAARVQHPNVAATLDIVSNGDELFLVMEYIQGESLSARLRACSEKDIKVPVPIAVSIAIGYLSGLHAAHEAKDEQGNPLRIVHRDVSPQNVLVGKDGVARLLDFGVARASMRLASTRDGQLKGKVRYMAPEQLSGVSSIQTDVYAAGVVLWETLTGQRLFRGENEAELFRNVMMSETVPPSQVNAEVSAEVDAIVMKALSKDPLLRWPSAHEMAQALDGALRPASSMAVSEWVQRMAGPALQEKAALVAYAESGSEPRGAIATLRAAGQLVNLENVDTGSAPAVFPPRSVGSVMSSKTPAALIDGTETLAQTVAPVPAATGRNKAYLGIGFGVLVLLLGFAFAFSHGSPREQASAATSPLPSTSSASAPPIAAVPPAAPPPAAATIASASAAPIAPASAVEPAANAAPKTTPRPGTMSETHGSVPKPPPKKADLKQLLDTR